MLFSALSGRASLKFKPLVASLASIVSAVSSTSLLSGALLSLSPAQAQVPSSEAVATDAIPAEAISLEATTQSWQILTSTAGNFSISMPSQPAAFSFLPTGNLSTAGSPATEPVDSPMYLQMQLVEATRLEIYAVASTKATDFIEPGDDANQSLLRCVSSLNNQNVQAIISTVRLGRQIGIEAESFSPDEGLQVSRCYLAGDRAYILSVTSKPFQAGPSLQPIANDSLPVEVRSQTMTAFLESFDILD